MRDLLRLIALFRPHALWVAAGVLLSLITVLANVGLLATSGWFITAMGLAGVAGVSMNYFTPAAIIRALAIARTLGRYAERVVTHEATFRVLAALRVRLFEGFERLDPVVLAGYRSGDLLNRMRADVDALESFLLRVLIPTVVAALSVAAICLFVALYVPTLAGALSVLLLIAGAVLPVAALIAGRGSSRRIVGNTARLNAETIETLQGMPDLLVYGAADTRLAGLDALGTAIIADQRRQSGLLGLGQAGIGLVANLALWTTLVLCIPLLRGGTLAGADMTMLALLTLAAFEAVAPLPGAWQSLAGVRAAAKRLFAVLDRPPLHPDPAAPTPLPARGAITFEGVRYRYPGRDAPALDGVDLTIPDGAKVALLGETGSGKSTLVALMVRFATADEGHVRFGSVSLDACAAKDARDRFAVVEQAPHVFTGSIRDNLAIAAPGADEAAMRRALTDAGLEDFLDGLADGLETAVGEAGMKLSGGQARRLAIARALLKDAPVLILDEPTEGLDRALAADVLDRVLLACGDRTVLLITHDRAQAHRMSAIVEMSGGKIVRRVDAARPDPL